MDYTIYRNKTTQRNTLRPPTAAIFMRNGNPAAMVRWLRDQLSLNSEAAIAFVENIPGDANDWTPRAAWIVGALADPGDGFRVLENELGSDAANKCVIAMFGRADIVEADYRKKGF